MPAVNPPVQKHTFAERRDRGKACLQRLRRFATECGMNIAAMKKPGGGFAGFFKAMNKDASTALEHAKHDGTDKGKGDIGGYDAQLTDERTKGHGNPPKVVSAANVKLTRKVTIGFTPKKSAVLSLRFIPAAHNRSNVVKGS